MYKLIKQNSMGVLLGHPDNILRVEDNAFIPHNPENMDYNYFKMEINEEKAELQDADGNTMTADDAKAYIATLP